nr:ATP-binding cassette domain-containing protein [Marinicella sp. W31]MDC2876954.1 ATP-binding cassette domain-containing protein [Marinicella sp. W31]
MDTLAKDLSGGEKARLLMGLAAFHAPNLLILDEPTNHLDIDSRRALITALNDFPGAVILIAHDRYLIEATVDRLWLVHGGTVKSYDGDMEDYRSLIIQGGKQRSSKTETAPGEDQRSKTEQRKSAADRRATFAPLKKEIDRAEKKTARIEQIIAKLDVDLADPKLYERSPEKAKVMIQARANAAAELAKVEEQWLELSAKYERAMGA